MRIIGGRFRGRTLAAFRGQEIRPTPDRVKESLFQILMPRLVGARVLDLFAGSGALGLESLSRGAREAVFNDASAESLAVLKKNLSALNVQASVTQKDFCACLKSAEGEFDIIFCDPPYRESFLQEICNLVKEQALLSEGGIVVYESEREERAEGFELLDERRYGRTRVTLWRQP